jgi:hypothetical protein
MDVTAGWYLSPTHWRRYTLTDWRFTTHPEGAKRREPIVGEFFATESISNVVSALVREFVQNSMDAAMDPDGPVEVHFSIGQLHKGDQTDKYFHSFWDHYYACDDSSRNAALPDLRSAPCRYLVAEDFGTTGLRGDPTVSFVDTRTEVDEINDFYYFIRTEGASGKSTTDRGNWGVGKYTYAKTSNINAFFAFSVRASPSPHPTLDLVLIGQSVLSYHRLDGTVFEPDGWWGSAGGKAGDVPMPFVVGDAQTEEFQKEFRLFRDSEPGLSIVVPFVAPNIDAGSLMTATLRNFLAPIIRGQLSVVIRGENDEFHELTSTTLETSVRDFDETLWTAFGPEIELVRWWHEHHGGGGGDAEGFFELTKPVQNDQASWSNRIEDEVASSIRERLEAGQRIGVRVPIAIETTRSRASAEWSYVDLLLGPDPDNSMVPTFYREGIRISEVVSDKIPNIRAVVLADDKPIAGFLGAAEGPAHTDWKNNRDRFSGGFRNGRNILAFIKRLPSGLVNRVRSGHDDTDLGVALDFFSIPLDSPGPRKTRKPSVKPPSGEIEVFPPAPPPPPEPLPVGLTDLKGGFGIVPGQDLNEGDRVVTDVAYDTLSGNPLTKWAEDDFVLSSESIRIKVEGARVIDRSRNRLELEVTDSKTFRATMTGFDVNRDLFIRAEVIS